MKNTCSKFLALSISYILFFTFACNNLSAQKERMIDIKDWQNNELPAFNLAIHEYKDVEVFKWSPRSEVEYVFAIYGTKNDTLNCDISFSAVDKDGFDKAFYRWESDTILLVRLYNTDTKKESKYRLTGKLLLGSGDRTLERL